MKNRALTLFATLSLAGLTSLGLTGCGGGKQGEKFTPSNIISFGDESSAFTSETAAGGTIKGLKYTVNALIPDAPTSPSIDTAAGDTIQTTFDFFPDVSTGSGITEVDAPVVDSATNTVTRVVNMDVEYTPVGGSNTVTSKLDITRLYLYNCGLKSVGSSALGMNRLWIQILADAFGMSYSSDCPLDTRGKAETFAAAGAKVADVLTQMSTNMSKISGNTLVTVLAGQNDILEQFDALYLAGTPSNAAVVSAESALAALGRSLGNAVNPMADIGARVLLIYVPDLSYSPKVVSDSAKAAVMNRLVVAFNDGIFSSGGARIDGTVIGLVDGYEVVRLMARNPSTYALINATDAVCGSTSTSGRSIDTTRTVAIASVADLIYCNDGTLPAKVEATASTAAKPAATAYNYLWASDTLLTPAGHDKLGQAAFNRVDNDTF